jgi:hypothetical protein
LAAQLSNGGERRLCCICLWGTALTRSCITCARRLRKRRKDVFHRHWGKAPTPTKTRRHSRLARHSHWDSGLTAAPLPASQYDLYTTSYSPDGRVFQVEYANKAVESSGLVPAPHPIQLPWHRSFSPRQSSSSCTLGAMPVSKHQLGRRSSRNIRGICRAPLRCISSAECLGRGALLASSLMDSQEF